MPVNRMAKAMPKVIPPIMSMVSIARVMPEEIKRLMTSLVELTIGNPGMRKMVQETSAYHMVGKPRISGMNHAKMVETKAAIMEQA